MFTILATYWSLVPFFVIQWLVDAAKQVFICLINIEKNSNNEQHKICNSVLACSEKGSEDVIRENVLANKSEN